MSKVNYDLFLELEEKSLFTKQQLSILKEVLRDINIEVDPKYRHLSRIRRDKDSVSVRKFGNINGLDDVFLDIDASEDRLSIKLKGYIDHYPEEMIYTWRKNTSGIFERYYESLSHSFVTRYGKYSLTIFPTRKTNNINAKSDFYNRDTMRCMEGNYYSTYEREGYLPTSTFDFSAKDIKTLARGAISRNLRNYIIDLHVQPDPEYCTEEQPVKRRRR